MSNSWDHFPNAVHIDQILKLINDPQYCLRLINNYVEKNSALYQIYDTILDQDIIEVLRSIIQHLTDNQEDAATSMSSYEERVQRAGRKSRREISNVVWGAAMALLLYDCDHVLNSSVTQVQLLTALGMPAAELLLPFIIANHEFDQTL